MLQRIKDILKFSSEHGLHLPAAYDKASKGPSVSLWFSHLAFMLAFASIVAQLFANLTLGVYCAIWYSGLMLAFYLLRNLQKVKLGKDGIDLEGEDDKPTPQPKEEPKDE